MLEKPILLSHYQTQSTQMNRPRNEAHYPRHHPHHGRPFIEVHNHDVLCGRGVNIAQHPGNERFRALVNTRQDESYCTTFSTSEKRALAEEIVGHIRKLDPPGRFLKRSGRSHSSRGLHGPWEELSHRECIKKTCQALRDCNRQDREGYGAQVMAPTDVAVSNEERVKSGLSLKAHAAAAVAKTNPSKLNPHHYHFMPTSVIQGVPASPHSNSSDDRKRASSQISADEGRLSPSVDLAARWLKKQRNQNPQSTFPSIDRECDLPSEPVLSATSVSHAQSTPAPFVAPVPVTNTPTSAPLHHNGHGNEHIDRHPYEDLAISHHTESPQLPSPAAYHPDVDAPAPYSPVVLLHDHEGVNPNSDLEPHPHLDVYSTDHHHHHTQQFEDHPHPFHTSHVHHHPIADVLQSAAAIAASSMGYDSHHHRNNSLSFDDEDGDDVAHDPLHISDM